MRPTKLVSTRRLTALAALLLTIPEQRFSLDDWYTSPEANEDDDGVDTPFCPKAAADCGTTACAVGWACFHPEFNAQGLKAKVNHPGWPANMSPTYTFEAVEVSGWSAVEYFWGLTNPEATYLFNIQSYPAGAGTAKAVSERIHKLITEREAPGYMGNICHPEEFYHA